MRVISLTAEMLAYSSEVRSFQRTIGIVPTMGALHEGHLSLIRLCRPMCDELVVSIYVNPTQFGPDEDLADYPRAAARDVALCEKSGVDVVFCPSDAGMYAPDHSTYVEESLLSSGFCGRERPGHFRGVTTIVAKLFNVVKPHVAVFGEKDYQQIAVIRRMVRDLNFDVRIVTAPIVREPDGLAMSSRNRYLSKEERGQASNIFVALSNACALFEEGERDTLALQDVATTSLSTVPDVCIEYLQIVDADSLQSIGRVDRPAVLLIAARVGKTRLIDNVVLHASETAT